MQQTLAKRPLHCNGRSRHIPLKILFITNCIGMIRMPMKPITSECKRKLGSKKSSSTVQHSQLMHSHFAFFIHSIDVLQTLNRIRWADYIRILCIIFGWRLVHKKVLGCLTYFNNSIGWDIYLLCRGSNFGANLQF